MRIYYRAPRPVIRKRLSVADRIRQVNEKRREPAIRLLEMKPQKKRIIVYT